MSTDLSKRLDRLAQTAPVSTPPGGLWQRGTRRRRLRRTTAVTVATLAVGAIAGAVAVLGLQAQRLQAVPVSGRHALGIPNRMAPISSWAPVASGPMGSLAFVGHARRHTGWFSSARAVFAVSATTGAYRFLDLPHVDLDEPEPLVLSPDGRHLAYWVTGSTAPNPVGFASYDATTGRTTVHRVPTRWGIGADVLGWVDDDRLLVSYAQSKGGRNQFVSFGPGRAFLWSASTGHTVPLSTEPDDVQVVPTHSGYLLADHGSGGLSTWDRSGSRTGRLRLGVHGTALQEVALSPSGGRMAARVWYEGWATRLAVVDMAGGDDPPGIVERLPVRIMPLKLKVAKVFGWRDDRHIVAARFDTWQIISVDTRDGSVRPVLRVPMNGVFATGLWTRPLVSRPAPPHAWDPRLVAGGSALVVLATATVGLVLWRRRALR